MTAAELHGEGVTLTAGARRLVHDITLAAGPGETIGLVGPNGSGKSSLLRAVYRVLRPESGTVRVDGDDIWSPAPRRVARTLAAVVQDTPSGLDLSVWEVISMGPYPAQAPAGDTTEDATLIESTLALVDAVALADGPFDRLSGVSGSGC
ncbi:ATP-binding cassette domain-containing protein [Streptomyces sp. NPDC001890]|uniref:ATP-binding cassette domain-containing protein n=1 Tax=Streptomyces sp. NPDC001890 TaxID=3364620 RepID=UPI0036A8088D